MKTQTFQNPKYEFGDTKITIKLFNTSANVLFILNRYFSNSILPFLLLIFLFYVVLMNNYLLRLCEKAE